MSPLWQDFTAYFAILLIARKTTSGATYRAVASRWGTLLALRLGGTAVARPALLVTASVGAAVKVAANTTDSSGTLPTATVKGHHPLKFNATLPIGFGTLQTAVAEAVRRSEIAVARPTGEVFGQLDATLV
jgi:hypothetical protein